MSENSRFYITGGRLMYEPGMICLVMPENEYWIFLSWDSVNNWTCMKVSCFTYWYYRIKHKILDAFARVAGGERW